MKQLLFLAALLIAMPVSIFSQQPNAIARAARTPSTGQSETAEQTVRRLENELREASLQGDVATIERITADEWVVQNPDTTQHTKPQLIAFYKAKGKPYVSIKDTGVEVIVFGNAAVVTGRSSKLLQGQTTPLEIQFTRIYAKLPAGWQVIGMQFHPITK
ncbi:MAG TPA: nuclear transport factor 2 family protein [Pyrinomonadaceae bacterium]|jgi:hypothetical protein|nr:nuclear transport factor 2 family protein [Pyrinomonadaceae bacterium]